MCANHNRIGYNSQKNLPCQKGNKAKKEINYLKMNHQPLNIKAISCLGVPPMGDGLFKREIINHVNYCVKNKIKIHKCKWQMK